MSIKGVGGQKKPKTCQRSLWTTILEFRNLQSYRVHLIWSLILNYYSREPQFTTKMEIVQLQDTIIVNQNFAMCNAWCFFQPHLGVIQKTHIPKIWKKCYLTSIILDLTTKQYHKGHKDGSKILSTGMEEVKVGFKGFWTKCSNVCNHFEDQACTVWTVNDVLSRSTPFYWVDPYP